MKKKFHETFLLLKFFIIFALNKNNEQDDKF